ncbi:hypothetical protein BJY00DRAFT_291765 [Aspergillus carlsbadensis]|nr:hypothetical protein BJY00DRAFT_291765 [Aspergillus carlsbadensis]
MIARATTAKFRGGSKIVGNSFHREKYLGESRLFRNQRRGGGQGLHPPRGAELGGSTRADETFRERDDNWAGQRQREVQESATGSIWNEHERPSISKPGTSWGVMGGDKWPGARSQVTRHDPSLSLSLGCDTGHVVGATAAGHAGVISTTLDS